MTDTEQLADVIALSIHMAMAPLQTKIALLEARPLPTVTAEALLLLSETVKDLQMRLADAEAREPIPGPPGEPGMSIIGPAGKDGSRLLTAIGPPTFAGAPDDVYLDVKTGDVYQWR